ncbi:hypothetical protein IJT93_09595 [bacterium]|nr:hypothetical protein [bacterium]
MGYAYWRLWEFLAEKLIFRLLKKDFSQKEVKGAGYLFIILAASLRLGLIFAGIWGAVSLLGLSAVPFCLGFILASLLRRVIMCGIRQRE